MSDDQRIRQLTHEYVEALIKDELADQDSTTVHLHLWDDERLPERRHQSRERFAQCRRISELARTAVITVTIPDSSDTEG